MTCIHHTSYFVPIVQDSLLCTDSSQMARTCIIIATNILVKQGLETLKPPFNLCLTTQLGKHIIPLSLWREVAGKAVMDCAEEVYST